MWCRALQFAIGPAVSRGGASHLGVRRPVHVGPPLVETSTTRGPRPVSTTSNSTRSSGQSLSSPSTRRGFLQIDAMEKDFARAAILVKEAVALLLVEKFHPAGAPHAALPVATAAANARDGKGPGASSPQPRANQPSSRCTIGKVRQLRGFTRVSARSLSPGIVSHPLILLAGGSPPLLPVNRASPIVPKHCCLAGLLTIP